MKSKRILMGCLGVMLAVVGIAQVQDSFPKKSETMVGTDGRVGDGS